MTMNPMKNEVEEKALLAEVVERIKMLYNRFVREDGAARRNPTLQAAILKYRVAYEAFGEAPLTQKQVGQMCNVNSSRVGQVEYRVINTLKKFLDRETINGGPKSGTVAAMAVRLKNRGILHA